MQLLMGGGDCMFVMFVERRGKVLMCKSTLRQTTWRESPSPATCVTNHQGQGVHSHREGIKDHNEFFFSEPGMLWRSTKQHITETYCFLEMFNASCPNVSIIYKLCCVWKNDTIFNSSILKYSTPVKMQ